MCQICDYFATEEGCGARLLVEYLPPEETAYVYHIGNHKCHMKLQVQSKQETIKRKAQGSCQRTGLAKRIVLKEIETLVGEGRMDEATDEADSWVDTRFAKRVLNEARKHNLDVAGEDNNSIDAVAIIKKQAGLKDEFYIYQINNGSMNESSDYVFKSSKVMAELSIQMDVEGPKNILPIQGAMGLNHFVYDYFTSP